MNHKVLAATAVLLSTAAPAAAQQGWGPWRMHDWTGWGWGGMVLGPLFMLAVLALFVALIVLLVRWLGGGGSGPASSAPRTARELLDERYARGEIDREEYLRRRQDISGP